MKRGTLVAGAIALGWYALSFAILHPLADGPVADSWLYGESARCLCETGHLRFAGFTEAMPVAQAVYGAIWSCLFGGDPASLDKASAVLAVLAVTLMYAMARRCGAGEWRALIAAALLMSNPCFLFLSFSFMTEIPFIAALLAAELAFAMAEGARERRWLWISAAFCVAAFLVRPFAGAAIVGAIGAILIFDAIAPEPEQSGPGEIALKILPFLVALGACAAIWIWLTLVRTPPWDLQRKAKTLSWVLTVSTSEYIRAGILAPLLYLGIVLSPMALLQLGTRNWYRILALAVILFGATVILNEAAKGRLPTVPELSCFGGWDNVLILRGMANRFTWHSGARWLFVALGSIGAGGLTFAAIELFPQLNRATAAVLIAALIYWAASLPLWLFNDRYYLVLVPAGALILAMAPMPEMLTARAAAFAMTLAMGLLSLGGVYAYQRGLAVVISARNELEQHGVKRSAIDAGYELNGEQLYRFPKGDAAETMKMEAGIPMITSGHVEEYTIASRPFAGTTIVQRLEWPGTFGLGHRYIYVLRRMHHRRVRRLHHALREPK